MLRIEARVPEYGWTTQKVFHLMNFVVNAGMDITYREKLCNNPEYFFIFPKAQNSLFHQVPILHDCGVLVNACVFQRNYMVNSFHFRGLSIVILWKDCKLRGIWGNKEKLRCFWVYALLIWLLFIKPLAWESPLTARALIFGFYKSVFSLHIQASN